MGKSLFINSSASYCKLVGCVILNENTEKGQLPILGKQRDVRQGSLREKATSELTLKNKDLGRRRAVENSRQMEQRLKILGISRQNGA